MKTSLSAQEVERLTRPLLEVDRRFAAHYPGESGERQPVHTVYGGAHLFRAETARKLGELALRSLESYAADPFDFARAIGLARAETLPAGVPQARRPADPALAAELASSPAARFALDICDRVRIKLQREPVEDFRLDYEDGYGNRPDAEEDAHAVQGAAEVARGLREGLLPPFIGIRIKPFNAELRARSIRTLDVFLTALLEATGGALPAHFVVTLAKVTAPEQVAALADLLAAIESRANLANGALKLELMIEMPQAILGADGRSPLPLLFAASRKRCVAAHFGTYDYTAGCGITAAHQHMLHPACDFAKHLLQVVCAGTGIWLSDGATNVMPVPVHKREDGGPALTEQQTRENLESVHRAWRLHASHVRHSLETAYYQGWDLHPAQLPSRYGAVFAFFHEGLEAAGERLRNFVAKAAQATLVGEVFDDAATGQGLLNFFLRAVNCGAIGEDEAVERSGLALAELRSRSFVKILAGRRT